MHLLGLAWVFLLFIPSSAALASADNPILFSMEIRDLAAIDEMAAVRRIDAEVAAHRASPEPDIRFIHTLMQLKADTLARAGHSLAAAEVYLELVAFTKRHRAVLGQNHLNHARKASKQFAAAGELTRAEEILRTVLYEERRNRAADAAIQATSEELARLAEARGDGEAAARYRRPGNDLMSAESPRGIRSTNLDGPGYEKVTIYYATGRAPTGDPRPDNFYGGARGEMSYGTAVVTIPKDHRPGALEKPSIWSLEFAPSIDRHIMLQTITPRSEDELFALMQRHLETHRTTDAFIFVHGFNVSFAEAAERTAQLAYDMSFSGLPILYSWPSRGETWSYLVDAAVVRLSGRHLLPLLEDVAARSGATRIHLIAHSMGNRALTDALELLALKRGRTESAPLFDQVVFAAPDVDAGLFSEVTTTIRPLARRMTLYASEHDWALRISQKLHGDAQRAGQGGRETLAVSGLDSIDMSALGDDILAHNYFAAHGSALVDLATLFWQNTAPSQRCGITADGVQGRPASVWVYRPEQCDGGAILPLVGHLRQSGVQTLAGVRDLLRQVVPDETRAQALEPIVARMLRN